MQRFIEPEGLARYFSPLRRAFPFQHQVSAQKAQCKNDGVQRQLCDGRLCRFTRTRRTLTNRTEIVR